MELSNRKKNLSSLKPLVATKEERILVADYAKRLMQELAKASLESSLTYTKGGVARVRVFNTIRNTTVTIYPREPIPSETSTPLASSQFNIWLKSDSIYKELKLFLPTAKYGVQVWTNPFAPRLVVKFVQFYFRALKLEKKTWRK